MVLMKKILKIIFQRFILKIINIFLSGTHFFRIKRFLLNLAGYKIGKNTKVVGPLNITGDLIVGENCWIGKELYILGNGLVTIGNNCDLAPCITFSTGGHEIGNSKRRAGEGKIFNITVKDGCWIGTRVTIINSVTISESCVVAAGALVNKDTKKSVVVGGVPAKVIKNCRCKRKTNKVSKRKKV